MPPSRYAHDQRIVEVADVKDLMRQMDSRGYTVREMYFKHNGSMEIGPWLPGRNYRGKDIAGYFDCESEFKLLVKLHKIVPDNIVRPLALVRFNGKSIGYTMEYVDGLTIGDYSDRPTTTKLNALEVLAKLYDIVELLHENFSAHGDPNQRNIIVSGERLVLIDPLLHLDSSGFAGDSGLSKAMRNDAKVMRNVRDIIELMHGIHKGELELYRRVRSQRRI